MPRLTTAKLVRVVLATVTSFISLAVNCFGESPCSLGALINVSISYSGNRYTLLSNSCSLLDSSGQSISLNTNLTLHGGPDGGASLDTAWLNGAVVFEAGTTLTLEKLRLLNVRFRQTSFLSLSAFSTPQLTLNSVTIETDCYTLYTLADARPANAVNGPSYLFLANYTSNDVRANSVNITCRLPALNATADTDFLTAGDSLEIYNALAAYALNASTYRLGRGLSISVYRNVTMSPALWKYGRPLLVTRNVTMRAALGTYNILDLQAIINAISVGDNVMFRLENFVIVNAGPLRGTLQQLSILPCFSIPVWFFRFTRIPQAPQLTLTNCTLLLPPSEYKYFKLWTLLATTEVHMSEIGGDLRAFTVNVTFANSTNETMRFSRLTGSGLDMVNITLTDIVRTVPNSGLVLDNPVLVQSFGSVPNATLVPVYDLSDLMAILGAMQTAPIPQGVAMAILTNISIDPQVWPADGYVATQPVLMVGQSNFGRLTWIDFQRTKRFIRVVGCSTDVYMYIQGIHLINPANGLLQPNGTALAGAPAAAVAAEGLKDVSIYLTNFQSTDTCGSRVVPQLILNQSTIVITYTEFRLVYNVVMRSVGTSTKGNGTAIGSQFSFEFGSVVKDNISLEEVLGWGWHGFKVILTYILPSGTSSMYNNVYEPLGDAVTSTAAKSSSEKLKGWQIALIVIGCILFLVLFLSLLACAASMRRLRHEVDIVKSCSIDKKSISVFAGQDPTSGGGHLGSSTGGGGSGRTPIGGASPSVMIAKGSPTGNGGGGGGGGGGDGTSDDSAAAAQFDRPPLEVLNSMMATLTQEMDDRHLTILEVIGQGGFGVVYRGMWKGLNVAVKTITFQDRVAGGEKAQHRAILEAAISSSLAHPNVVTTYSYDIKPLTVRGTADGDSPNNCYVGTKGQNGDGGGGGGFKIIDKRPVLDWKLYLIQEYCDGGSLRTAIIKRKFFDAKKGEPRMEMLLDTCLELTGGLVHLHERNIIHGDLNPNNVLLKRDTSKKYGAICKIADFGLSIKMSADQSHISNMRRGTPFYTCPQIISRGNMTKAADVYSMGVMMWEMYHCCMSYRSLPSGFTARENFPNFPRKAPHDFARLVGSCLNSEHTRRPTFTQLRTELEAQLQAFKRGELRSGNEILGPDPSGDAAHLAACQD